MPWSWWLSPGAGLLFLGSSAWYGFVLVIVDDIAGFRDEVQALLEQHGISVVGGMSTYDEREYADLTEASPAVGFLAKTDLSAVTIQRRGGVRLPRATIRPH